MHDLFRTDGFIALQRSAWGQAREPLRADNDLTVARLDGITTVEFAHGMRSFKGLATKRPEYRA